MAWDEEMTSKTATTSRNRNRGCTKKKCLIITFSLIVLAALIAFYIALVCQHMDLFVVDATMSAFNVTERQTTRSKDSSFYLSEVALNLSLLFKNPTPSMGTYHYHQLNWRLFYHNITIAKGSIHPFSQGPHHTHLPIELHLKGANIALPHTAVSALQKKSAVLKLQASTTAYVQLLGKFIDYEFPVYCNLSFPRGKAHLHSKTTCIVKAG